MTHIQYWQSKRDQLWRSRIKEGDLVLCFSEGIVNRTDCLSSIDSARQLAQGQPQPVPFKGQDGRYYWHLKGRNGEIIYQSTPAETETTANARAHRAMRILTDGRNKAVQMDP